MSFHNAKMKPPASVRHNGRMRRPYLVAFIFFDLASAVIVVYVEVVVVLDFCLGADSVRGMRIRGTVHEIFLDRGGE
jgi:hypothetical protein